MTILRHLCAFFGHPWLAFAFRLYIGGVFVYASMAKISYPAEFANNIASYQLLPYWAVNVMAVFLPWFELCAGVLLILGVRLKAVALAASGMLVVFAVAIAINLLRDTPMGCGCFTSSEEQISLYTLLRDLIWLGMALHVYRFDRSFQLERHFLLAVKEV